MSAAEVSELLLRHATFRPDVTDSLTEQPQRRKRRRGARRTGVRVSADETKQLREVVGFLGAALLRAPVPHTVMPATLNALPVKVRRRNIPRPLAALGATMAYQVTDDSLAGMAVLDGDLLYVGPSSDIGEAIGRLVVCDVNGEGFAKELELKRGRIRLLSRNERYAPIEGQVAPCLVGVVLGRMGNHVLSEVGASSLG